MQEKQAVFQIEKKDNVATALTNLTPGTVQVRGESRQACAQVLEQIHAGHKLALENLPVGTDIIKYGIVIGRAVKEIKKGQWVHLHNMKSLYDARSSSLDAVTGAPTDTKYE